jgi:hypothetical protein
VLYAAKIINEDDKYKSCRERECYVKMDQNPYVVIYRHIYIMATCIKWRINIGIDCVAYFRAIM